MEKKAMLFVELQTIEKSGITLWLEGEPSNSDKIAEEIFVHENDTYMRDYVYDEGGLKEIRFNKICNF